MSRKRKITGNLALACSGLGSRTTSLPAENADRTALPESTSATVRYESPASTGILEPTKDTGPVLLITPYVNEADMAKAMGFSWSEDSPCGYPHTGIDFATNGDLRAFRAVCSGFVEKVKLWQLDTPIRMADFSRRRPLHGRRRRDLRFPHRQQGGKTAMRLLASPRTTGSRTAALREEELAAEHNRNR